MKVSRAGLLFLIVALVISRTTYGTETVLVPTNAVWKYLDNGTDQGTAWRGTNFDDSAWANGPAELGFGDGGEATVVNGGPAGNRYMTTYFRQSFHVPDPSAFTVMKFHLLRDDGAVVYLNSNEVWRSNMPVGPVDYMTPASGAATENVYVDTVLSPALFLAGTNWLSVEIHQNTNTSSDISFVLGVTGSDVITLMRGPYLQAATMTGICVMVECDSGVPLTVQYGLTTGYGSTAQTTTSLVTTAGTYVHRLQVTGLEPDTLYHYRVVSSNTNTPDGTFHTLGTPGTDFRFAWMADCRAPGVTIHDQVSARIASAVPLLSLYGGDLCDTSSQGLYSAYTNEFFRANERALDAQVPFYNTVGNHETWGQNTKAFAEAPASASGTQDYYSFDVGDLHVLVLNYILTGTGGAGYAPGSPQYNFASNDLVNCTSPWKVVTCHEPAYVFGGNHTPSTNIRSLATNIFEKAGVDVMLSGHTHFFEHILTNRVHYFIVGSAGAELKGVGGPDPSLIAAASNYCYAVADVTYTSLTMVVYTETGAVLDTLTLTKLPRPASLAVLTQPAATHGGAALAPSFQVAVRDIKNNVIATATNTVIVSLGSNPAGGVLSGTLVATATNGVATFTNLYIDKMGAGYTLVASVDGLAVTSSVFNVLFVDANSNGIADDWETDYFGGTNTLGGAATADWDGDGALNSWEFTAGTNPTNALDSFNLSLAAANGQLVVSFPARAAGTMYLAGYGRHYALLASTNLTLTGGGWAAVTGYADVLGVGQTVSYTNAAGAPVRFFRAKTWLQSQ